MVPFVPALLLRLFRLTNVIVEQAEHVASNVAKAEASGNPALIAQSKQIAAGYEKGLAESLRLGEDHAQENGLHGSAIAFAQLRKRVEEQTIKSDEIKARTDELRDFVIQELSSHSFFMVLKENQAFLDSDKLFNASVKKSFPSAWLDLQEAATCVAMERGTATVFHLMRAMEHVLRAIAKPLGVPYAPSWESYITQMNGRIAAKHSTKSRTWKRQQPLFIELLGDLQSIKIAWRNPTMHITRHYAPSEAREVFNAVRTFIQKVAPHFAEATASASRAASSRPTP